MRSRAQLTYAQVQTAADGAREAAVPETLPDLLRRVGTLRQERERARGGVSLIIPEQGAEGTDGGYVLRYRATLPAEGWNAQVSLLTGIAAAGLMREAGVGVLRSLPPADPRDTARLRRTALALGVPWPVHVGYADLLATLDSAVPAHAAFLNEATTLFRGADYLPFTGAAAPVGDDGRHAAIAAHVTAPLRRLVDRYGLEVCLAACAGRAVPDWVLEALPALPGAMRAGAGRAGAYERGALDALEALVLEGHVGDVFRGVVVDADDGRGTVVLRAPAVRARVTGEGLPVGRRWTSASPPWTSPRGACPSRSPDDRRGDPRPGLCDHGPRGARRRPSEP